MAENAELDWVPRRGPRDAGVDFARARREWAQALGPEHVKDDPATIGRYSRSTAPRGAAPCVVLYPATTREVQAIVAIAGRCRVPLYPISRGCNWGYGDACAPTQGQAIVDLGRMNTIHEVNARLAYAVIEPGVTQGQLFKFLRANHPGLWMDCSAAGPGASLVGNTLDRGFGHTRYADHFLNTCGMEVVLADGSLLNTGYTHYENAQAGRVYRYGVGASFDGLFGQSNFGIVTRIGLWLMPAPEAFCAFFFRAPNDADLADVIERLAPLRMQGLITSAVHVANDLRAISGRRRYPWERAGGRTPLPEEVRGELRREMGVGAWNGCGAITGTRQTVAATRRRVLEVLAPYKPRTLSDRTLAAAQSLQRLLSKVGMGQHLGELLETVKPVYALLKGEPDERSLRGALWRVRGEVPGANANPNPLEAHAGFMWVSPVVPTTGPAARQVMDIMNPIATRHGFELLVTFTLINERAMCCVTNVAFDTRVAEEGARALACYDELYAALIAAGYIPYRTGPRGFDKLDPQGSTFWDTLAQLKRTLDPQNIIAPGRYQPKPPNQARP